MQSYDSSFDTIQCTFRKEEDHDQRSCNIVEGIITPSPFSQAINVLGDKFWVMGLSPGAKEQSKGLKFRNSRERPQQSQEGMLACEVQNCPRQKHLLKQLQAVAKEDIDSYKSLIRIYRVTSIAFAGSIFEKIF